MRGVEDHGVGPGPGASRPDVVAAQGRGAAEVAACTASSMVSPHSRTASAMARGIDVV